LQVGDMPAKARNKGDKGGHRFQDSSNSAGIRRRIRHVPIPAIGRAKEQAGNNFPEFSQSRTKLWLRLLTLPPRRPKDRSPTRTPAGNPRSGRRRSGKTGWGHPLFGRNVSLYRIHFHRYWTGVRFRFVEVSEVSAALNAPVGLPIFCRK